MGYDLQLVQEQKQKISAAQIQSLKLLEMNNCELREQLDREYLENPLLEYEHRSASVPIENGYIRQEQHQQEIPNPEASLRDFIIGQLNAKKYSRREWAAIKFCIDALDSSGFLPMSQEELARVCGLSEETAHRLLTDLKKLEPCGIFAFDLRECLLLQLYARGIPDSLVKVLICDHLEALGRGEVAAVAKKLSLPTAQIRSALKEISSLDPRPLNGLDTARTDYVIPDLIIRYDSQSQSFCPELRDEWTADYRISDYYLQMIRQNEDPQLRSYFEQKFRRAKYLIEGIEQRRKTILDIGAYLCWVQRGFFEGKESKSPVTMTQAAQELGIAVSTVSRAVKDKYVQCPAGTIPFKELFETPGGTNAAFSREEIKAAIRQLVEQEDKTAPLSDAAIEEKLGQMGMVVSRRTVTKYRESVGIPNGFARRE